MEQVVDRTQNEFWRPPVSSPRTQVVPQELRSQVEACHTCGTEFVVGARFCHVCGSERESLTPNRPAWIIRALDFGNIRRTLGLSAGSLVAFLFGLICVIAAVVTGFLYNAQTALDWQAIQSWRMQWLLASVAAFAAGILLKRSEA